VKARVALALTLALTTCSAASEVDRGVAMAYQGDDQPIKDSPTSAAEYANRGVTRAHQGDLDGAIADYTEALALAPPDAEVLFNRGSAMIAKKDYQGAIADLTLALSIDPHHAKALFARGTARSLTATSTLPAPTGLRDRSRAGPGEKALMLAAANASATESAPQAAAAGGNACSAAGGESPVRGRAAVRIPATLRCSRLARSAATPLGSGGACRDQPRAAVTTQPAVAAAPSADAPARRPRQAATPRGRRAAAAVLPATAPVETSPTQPPAAAAAPAAARCGGSRRPPRRRQRGARAGVSGDRHRSRRCRAFSGVRGRADKRLAPANRGRAARFGSGAGAARLTRAGGPRPRERAQRGPRRCAR
jgi:hypothetical protein